MKVSVLVPWHPATEQRQRVWAYLKPQWTGLVDEVIDGVDPDVGKLMSRWAPGEPCPSGTHAFSVSRALNNAARRATGDVFLLFGADHVPDAKVVEWAKEQLGSHGFQWTPLFRELAYASEDHTYSMLSDSAHNPARDQLDWERHPSSCPGVLAVTRTAWEAIGGMDEDFEGPGYEDNDLVARLSATYQQSGLPSPYTLRELWHGTDHRDYSAGTRNAQLFRSKHPLT